MKKQLKKIPMLQGKKRYIVMGLLAVELMSLPAAAQIVHRVAFDIRPVVTAVQIPTSEPGVSRYLVASNAGFGVTANGVIGDIKTEVHVSGTMSGTSRFGDAAQLPGAEASCAQASGQSAPIYIADRKTAASPGTPPDQAVVFEFRYDPVAQPKFEFVAGEVKSPTLISCSNATS